MGLLKHFRSKSRLAGPQPTHTSTAYNSPPTPYRGRDHTQRLPDPVLALILAYVCPHTQDSSYLPSERSQIDSDGCMLCDLRDLAHCASVSRKWYGVSQKALYGSVRIDAVHYCALEEELAQRRRKGGGKGMHFRSKSSVLTVEAGEVPSVRLSLLCRTVRESEFLAHKVLVLKLPYMTRETAKGELARCVSALPNLRYVDLPDGFFTGDPSCLALRQELQARCPDIRKMSYRPGSEDALELLARRHWQSIEILELSGLAVEPATLRIVLASLPTLRVLTLSEMNWLDDSIFQPSPGQLPDFPPVQSLRLESTPGVTAEGLTQWLSVPHNREALTSISLQSTGVTVQDLHHILWQASQVQHLSISETVSKSLSLATTSLPPLTSISLRTLHFEITSSEDVHGLQKPAESYYAYLASSLHQNALPGLITLYVRDPDFPELLLLPPVTQPFATSDNGGMNASSLRSKPSDLSSYTNNSLRNGPKGTASGSAATPNTRGALSGTGFTQTLEVFSKGLDELEWVFTSIAPTPSPSWDPHNTNSPRKNSTFSSSGGRPLSAYSAGRGLGPQWAQGGFGGEARKSVIVGNGFGGFLAVPQEEVPRPMTSDGGAGVGGGVRVDGVGGTRWGSIGSVGTGGSAGAGSLLKPPPSLGSLGGGGDVGKRGSRHDLWR
ncbi:hypothetical protein LTS16_005838 [Friedmanniomyces endolithicus]|nr:hypothetical protein LTR94_004801 [Friedmanniomyces endolithicus]KAK0813857.1 hypothetical protein LTR59_001012 [Friedmanniomyces endolithicus]KAK0814710.1 hypothetical protein LTR38_002540 [Friedmanniomyces endolithicus]KAK0862347.1 hypothetical protein LTS02_007222 [Friedmanniomyces endolithicus]KAK0885944.1 hypothetical protein LTR87_000007 [Friedmanniomyces endolithicus]